MDTKQDSNLSGLAITEEVTLGVLPTLALNGADPIWRRVEPNSYSDFGGETSTVARDPINPSRQRQKGTLVDLDASGGFNHDFVMTGLTRLMQSFFFAAARQKPDTKPLNGVQITLTATTAGAYTAAAGLGSFLVNQLVFAQGFATAANNGLRVVATVAAASLGVTPALTVEAAPPTASQVQAVGYQFPSGDASLVVTAANIRLVSATVNCTTLGLTPGEWVYLGGDAVTNRFVQTVNKGYARVKAIDATGIDFDQSTFTAVADAGTAKLVQIFFGTVLRNEKTPALIKRLSLQMERTVGPDDNGTQAEYLVGAVANELTINIPLADKLNVDMSFVGIDVGYRTGLEGLKTGSRVEPSAASAVNTSSDIVRSQLAVVNPALINSAALVGYISEGSISINNGVTPNKAVGKLGAFNTSAGNFMVDASLTGYFSDIAAIKAVRANADVGYNLIAAQGNKGVVFDLPLLTLGGGRLNVEKDAPIMIPLENAAGECAAGYTMLFVQFNYLPTTAMPV